jgi:hypothetical protein
MNYRHLPRHVQCCGGHDDLCRQDFGATGVHLPWRTSHASPLCGGGMKVVGLEHTPSPSYISLKKGR